MAIEFLLEEGGVREVCKRIEAVESRPVLVAVYGLPHSGKNYLIDRVREHFAEGGLPMNRPQGSPDAGTFEDIKNEWGIRPGLLFFHCGWERDEIAYRGGMKGVDPNLLAREILGREIDLNIGVYNPDMYGVPKGTYDLIISNPRSKKKKLKQKRI